MTLALAQRQQLEQAWRDGLTYRAATAAVGCNYTTTVRYFGRFRDLKIPRKPTVRRRSRRWDPPPYTGPAWIGKPGR